MSAKLRLTVLVCLLAAVMVFSALGEAAVGGMSPEDSAIVDDFLENFRLLAASPRQSKHEQAVSDFLKGWAEAQGYEVRQNEAHDLFSTSPRRRGTRSCRWSPCRRTWTWSASPKRAASSTR